MAAGTEAGSRSTAWAPLRNQVYRNLFMAQLASNIGSWMQMVGAQWFLVAAHTSPTMVALVQTASLAPTLMLALPAGALADIFDRRRLLIVTTAYTMVAAAALTALTVTGVLTPVLLLVLTFAMGCGAALSAPPWQAIQPELVPREQIRSASALGSVTVNAARAIGPAIAGLVVAAAGPAAVFALNTVSFAGVIVALALWRRAPSGGAGPREPFWHSFVSGGRYVKSAPIVRRILLRAGLFAFPASALWALLPLASAQHWHQGAAGYGLVLACLGAGAVAGVAVVPVLRKWLPDNALLAVSTLIYAAGTLACACLPFAFAVIPLMLSGTAWLMTLTTLNTAAQLSLAPWARSRGLAVYLLVFMGAQAFGSVVWGAVASHTGLATSLVGAAVCLVVVAATVIVLPLHPCTGKLDREVSTAWPAPQVVMMHEPDDGPVLITTSYRVADDALAEFIEVMYDVGQARRRTGGHSWRLYRNGQHVELVVEQFVVPSWAEFHHQHTVRWLSSDHDHLARAVALTVDGRADQQSFFRIR
jgi:MFS family permease